MEEEEEEEVVVVVVVLNESKAERGNRQRRRRRRRRRPPPPSPPPPPLPPLRRPCAVGVGSIDDRPASTCCGMVVVGAQPAQRRVVPCCPYHAQRAALDTADGAPRKGAAPETPARPNPAIAPPSFHHHPPPDAH